MPANPSTSEMGRRHVERAALALGAVPSAGSGNRWQNPADGRSPHDGPYPVALEGKSTRGKSIAVTLEMIAKLREQSLGENPVLPLCWYGTDDLTEVTEDWAAVPLDFLAEVLASARAWVEVETSTGGMTRDNIQEYMGQWGRDREAARTLADGMILAKKDHDREQATIASMRQALTGAHDALTSAGERLAAQDLELQELRDRQPRPAGPAHHVPRLPWTVVHVQPKNSGWWAGDVIGIAVRHEADGTQVPSMIFSVRVQRSAGNRPHLFVDNLRVRNGDLYNSEGQRAARVCEDDPSIEVG